MTKDRLFKDMARECHKVSKTLRIRMLAVPIKGNAYHTFYCVGEQRFATVDQATFEIIMALRRVRHAIPDPLLRRLEAVYGAQTTSA
jgi:hypothetical protein